MTAKTLWNQADSNRRKSIFFIFFFVVVIVALGWLFSYIYNSPAILIIAVFIAIVQSAVGFFAGDSIILATSGAQQIEKRDNPELWRIVENLAITAGLPMPRVYIIDDQAPNAFATGRDPEHSSIAVTTGLLRVLNKNELQGVIAHEMSHVGNYDIRLMMIVAILVSIIALLSDLFIRSRLFGFGRSRDNQNEGGGQIQAILLLVGIVAAILAPIAAFLIQLAVSRHREFLADADGALLTRFPDGLADALEKINKYSQPVEHVSSATAHLYISDPMAGERDEEGEPKEPGFFTKIFSTHPPVAERIRALRGMDV